MHDNDEHPLEGSPKKPKRRVYARIAGCGSLLKLKLNPAHYRDLKAVQKALLGASGHDISTTMIMRRALEAYVLETLSLAPEELKAEAAVLINRFR